MTWPPGRKIRGVIVDNAPHCITASEFSSTTRVYLREFFEALIRLRSDDSRLSSLWELRELVACYEEMTMSDALSCLTELNLTLQSEDRRVASSQRPSGPWQPLLLTRKFFAVAEDVGTYVESVTANASMLSELLAAREVVEAVLAVACLDARREYLNQAERDELTRLAGVEIGRTLAAYSTVNAAISRLDLDSRIDVTRFVVSPPYQ